MLRESPGAYRVGQLREQARPGAAPAGPDESVAASVELQAQIDEDQKLLRTIWKDGRIREDIAIEYGRGDYAFQSKIHLRTLPRTLLARGVGPEDVDRDAEVTDAKILWYAASTVLRQADERAGRTVDGASMDHRVAAAARFLFDQIEREKQTAANIKRMLDGWRPPWA